MGRAACGTADVQQGSVAARVAQRAAAIAAAYQAYINNQRLNVGQIHAIQLALGPAADLAAVNARLVLVYGRQCTITQPNWLMHLDVAGHNIDGTRALHYTKYNNAVTIPVGLRVDLRTRPQLCATLFASAARLQRLHATRVVGGQATHRYWGDPVTNDVVLDAEYDRLWQAMRALVLTAKNNHGRVGDNANGMRTGFGP
jgi:hypothetical protein